MAPCLRVDEEELALLFADLFGVWIRVSEHDVERCTEAHDVCDVLIQCKGAVVNVSKLGSLCIEIDEALSVVFVALFVF